MRLFRQRVKSAPVMRPVKRGQFEIGTVHGRQAKYNKTLVQMNNILSQKSLHHLPQDVWFMILNNLPGEDVRRFLYTCKQSLTGFIWCFAKHRTDNGLIYAAKYRDRYLLRNVLSNTEVDVNTKDERGWTALVWAVHWSDEVMVRTLATHPIIDTQRPLRYAIASMQLEIVKLMLQIGKVNFDATDNHGRTLVHEAVIFGGISIAELLASQVRTLDFEKVDKKGKTPLHWAIRYGYMEVMDFYFFGRDAQSNLHILENNLLLYAIRHQNELIALEILRLPGFQLAIDPQDDPLHLAIRSGLGLVVEELQLHITDPNTTNEENYNAIQYTPRAKNKAIASRLLDSGVSLPGDESVLWATAQGADYQTFRLFLLHEGYVVFHNSTCLKYAIRGGEEKVIRKVLQMTTSIDHDVILAAVESDRPRVLLLILKHSKDHYQNITTQINFGDLLIHAIQHDAISVIRILLCELHVDPCYAKHGRTALSYAAKRGRTDVISHLLRYDKVAPNLPDSDGEIPLDHILAGPEPHRETFQQNLELLALDSRTTPSSFNDGGKNMMQSLRRAHQYRLLETLRERGFEDEGYRKRKVTHENTKTYNFRSRRAKHREL